MMTFIYCEIKKHMLADTHASIQPDFAQASQLFQKHKEAFWGEIPVE